MAANEVSREIEHDRRWGPRGTAAATIAGRLTFENVSLAFGKVEAVREVSFELAPGEIACLLGPSGCGKTTLLRIAAGVERPQSGRVAIDGVEVAGPKRFVPPERRNVGLVFQDFALFPHLSILDNVAFGLNRLPRWEAVRRRVRRSNGWASAISPAPSRMCSRAASSSGWRWRGRSCRGPR
jgi:ABC-type taurine transport system ATPase subunit